MEISHNHLLNRPAYPSHMAFRKMEALIKSMQDPVNGITVKSQKLFLTTITNAFTGEDLVDWIVKNLSIKDTEEAIHLATLVFKYGYFFHVSSSNVSSVKQDTELYRFQAPYFWVSTNWNAGNTDYAIYLVKRTMRNQEKHALNDSETQILEDLRKKLTNQWDFIRIQADAQLRIFKERKKTEKTFIDSQEKAFWKIVRPLNDNNSVLDEDMRVTLMHGVIKPAKREEFFKKKVLFFQQLLKNRIRTKSSQTLQGLCAYSEAYYEYDGLFGHCLPSNPWISDDIEMWEVNKPLVEQPTQLRVKKWSFSFKELLTDPTGVREFMKYCETEFSTENLKFYLACQEYKSALTSELPILVQKIYKEHLTSEGDEVNINDGTRNKIIKRLENPTRDIFYEAEKHIYELMKKNGYPRFEQSDHYKNLLDKAIIPGAKKR